MDAPIVYSIAVGVFENRDAAQAAIDELRQLGFDENHVGVAARDADVRADVDRHSAERPKVAEGLALGAAGGAGAGALWGLGILAGVLPAIGPVIAAGTLSAVLASATVGATTGGLAGLLAGWGIEAAQANEYVQDLRAGRILVAVRANGRLDEVNTILRKCGARVGTYPSSRH
jgi:uncharacterized membrane protein